VEVLPGLSSLQLAFSRIKEGYSNAVFVSLHARGLKELFAHVPHAQKIGILTDPTNAPKRIASELLERVGPVYKAYVLENLGYDNERVSFGELEDIALKDFEPLNVMVLLKKEPGPKEAYPILGVLDEEFVHRTPDKGLITKSEVRAISLSKLGLTETSVVYDIGAGSGSVGLEAARMAKKGMVYAIEKNLQDLEHIKQNRLRLGVANLEIIEGEAPEALRPIPEPPDAVFVGGSGGKMEGILKELPRMLRPQGRIVINIARIETLFQAHESLKRLGFEAEVTLIQAARSKGLMGLTRLLGLNPVFIVTGRRKS
jgi:precorrin-6Y C5,15-methyltransferase (decarboxylating)